MRHPSPPGASTEQGASVYTLADSLSVIDSDWRLFDQVLADSPVPSFVTTHESVVVKLNKAAQQLFHLNEQQVENTIGRYAILRDKNIRADEKLHAAISAVYGSDDVCTYDFHYALSNLHANRFLRHRKLYLRASFVPIKTAGINGNLVLVQLQDMSREKNVSDALQESEASYKAFITNSSEAIWCYEMEPKVNIRLPVEEQVEKVATNARLVEANKVLLTMLGASSLDEILGMGLMESGSTNYVLDLHYLINNNYQMIDHDIIRQDSKGKQYYFQVSCTGIVEDGFLKRVWGTTKDIAARKRYEEKLRHQSLHDSLTSLPNREKLREDIDLCIANRSPDQISALLLIDLDRFKEINDTLGHGVGDQLLQLIGPRLSTEMSEVPGTVARLGGDEFAIF